MSLTFPYCYDAVLSIAANIAVVISYRHGITNCPAVSVHRMWRKEIDTALGGI
jgi:hypothetical protein